MSKLLKAYDRSRVPLYIQVAAVMRQRIERQQWRPGEKISTLAELEQEFEVARQFVRLAGAAAQNAAQAPTGASAQAVAQNAGSAST